MAKLSQLPPQKKISAEINKEEEDCNPRKHTSNIFRKTCMIEDHNC